MSDYDPTVAAALEGFGPAALTVEPDWDRILNDAALRRGSRSVSSSGSRSFHWSRRRLLILAASVAAVLAIPLIAFAATNGWWFQHAAGPQMLPSNTNPSVVATGSWQGRHWTLIAYPASMHFPAAETGQAPVPGRRHVGLCTFVIFGSLSNAPQEGSCGPLRGLPGSQAGGPTGGWLTGMAPSDPPLVLGAVAEGVTKVELTLQNYLSNRTARVTVPLRSVSGFGGGIRFYLYQSTMSGVTKVTAFDNSDHVLGTWSP